MDKTSKLKTREEISKICEQLRKKGKKIVSCNGAFDLFHVGHIKFLEEAKAQGDILVVGLNSDKSVKEYKSKDRPLIPQQYRAETLAALSCVDYITIFDEPIPIKFVESIKPNVHVNGAEYGENCVEAEAVKKYGGKVRLVKRFGGFSTTELINKIIKLYRK